MPKSEEYCEHIWKYIGPLYGTAWIGRKQSLIPGLDYKNVHSKQNGAYHICAYSKQETYLQLLF